MVSHCSTSVINTIRDKNGSISSDPVKISNIFNDYFVNVAESKAKNISRTPKCALGPRLHGRKWNGSVWNGSKRLQSWSRLHGDSGTVPNGSTSCYSGGGKCAATNYVITGAKCGCSPFEYFFVKMAAKNTKTLFKWTEEETALLLKGVLDYKTAKLAIAQDWETIRSKYDNLAKHLIEAYPNEVTDEFPRGQTKETFSAAKVSSKVKKLKNSFRKALDTGRKSGGGRIVSSLYKECSDIWAGCPAAICIDGGFETTALTETTDADESLSEEKVSGRYRFSGTKLLIFC